jgi:hypothetical protein
MTVNQIPETVPGAGRNELGFVDAARCHFGFLADLGFTEERAEPTYLRFEKGDTFVEVFHGRASFELGIELGHRVRVDDDDLEQKFHIVDVAPVLAPEIHYTARTATTKDQVERFVEELAATTRPLAERVERDGTEAFELISQAVAVQSEEYLQGLRAARLRSRADEAWRRKDFASVVSAYAEIESELESVGLRPSEAKRLDYARRQIDSA